MKPAVIMTKAEYDRYSDERRLIFEAHHFGKPLPPTPTVDMVECFGIGSSTEYTLTIMSCGRYVLTTRK